MNTPSPGKDKPSSSPRKDPPAARREPPGPKRVKLPLLVRFWSAMRRQRVFPLTVAAPRRLVPDADACAPVVVRPVVAGALVVPAEQPLDVSLPGAAATFHVTPLALGRLPGARVEVAQQGRALGQIPLRMKGKRQLMTWVLAALTVLVPTLLHVGTVVNDYSSSGEKVKHANVPEPAGDQERPPEIRRPPRPVPPVEKLVLNVMPDVPNVRNNLASWAQAAYDMAHSLQLEHLSFWVAVALLGLTALSWLGHRNQRARLEKTIEVPAQPVAAPTADTVAMGPTAGGAVAVEPVD